MSTGKHRREQLRRKRRRAEKIRPPVCAHCGSVGIQISAKEIYPHRNDLWRKVIWKCSECDDSRCGCHGNTRIALGTMANAKLRAMRMTVHRRFDPIWKGGSMTRTEAYRFLADNMGLSADDCHVGMFTESQCFHALRVIDWYHQTAQNGQPVWRWRESGETTKGDAR